MSFYYESDKKIFISGTLTMGLPVLAKTVNGTITCPSIYVDSEDSTKICNFFTNLDGSLGDLYTLNPKTGTLELFEQTPINEMKNPKRKTLSIRVNQGFGQPTKWVNLELWEDIAKFVHKNCKGGEEIFICGKKKQQDPSCTNINEICSVNYLEILVTAKDKAILKEAKIKNSTDS